MQFQKNTKLVCCQLEVVRHCVSILRGCKSVDNMQDTDMLHTTCLDGHKAMVPMWGRLSNRDEVSQHDGQLIFLGCIGDKRSVFFIIPQSDELNPL